MVVHEWAGWGQVQRLEHYDLCRFGPIWGFSGTWVSGGGGLARWFWVRFVKNLKIFTLRHHSHALDQLVHGPLLVSKGGGLAVLGGLDLGQEGLPL
jgi:hypothetical protein